MVDLSYQLYSSRNFTPLDDTLRMLNDLGYSQVEGYGGVFENLRETTGLLKETGLTMPSGHFGLDMLESDPAQVLEIAEACNMKAVYCPHIAEELRPVDAAGWRAFGARVQKAGEPIREAGLIYGWHNHDFELRPDPNGKVPLEEIFAGGPELSWEADIAWIQRGGADPLDWIARHGTRLSAAHIKDIAPAGACEDEDGWADVGEGVMDWPAIWRALQATPCSIFVIEHDNPSDHHRFARRSITNVAKL